MRKAIRGLSRLVESEFDLDPFSGSIFVFCNRRKDTVKALYYSINGFCLFQKKLQRQRFCWPDGDGDKPLQIRERELRWLLEGLQLQQPKAHKPLMYETLL